MMHGEVSEEEVITPATSLRIYAPENFDFQSSFLRVIAFTCMLLPCPLFFAVWKVSQSMMAWKI